MKDKTEQFEVVVGTLPPKGKELIDSLFGRYSLPLPNISAADDDNGKLSICVVWGYDEGEYSDDIFAEFSWHESCGYSWFGYIGTATYGSEEDSNDPVPPEADEFIRKIFPQTEEEKRAALFDKEALTRVVKYYGR